MKQHSPLIAPPPDLRKAHLDNIAIVPASMLPTMKRLQALANELPRGSVLIAAPHSGRQTEILQRVAQILVRHGHTVRLIKEPSSL